MQPLTLDDYTLSSTAVRLGIDNSLPDDLLFNAQRTIDLLNEIQAFLGKQITITSGYRCLALNMALRSRDSSSHVMALAADIVCHRFGDARQVTLALTEFFVDREFDQLILEFGRWTHIGIGSRNRRELLTITRAGVEMGIK